MKVNITNDENWILRKRDAFIQDNFLNPIATKCSDNEWKWGKNSQIWILKLSSKTSQYVSKV